MRICGGGAQLSGCAGGYAVRAGVQLSGCAGVQLSRCAATKRGCGCAIKQGGVQQLYAGVRGGMRCRRVQQLSGGATKRVRGCN